ncbi:transposase [Patescibacteria group bacterium]
MRKFEFQSGEYYHIFNQGVDKRNVFLDAKDYIRFIRSMREFNRIEPIGSLYTWTREYEDLSIYGESIQSNPNPLKDSGCLVDYGLVEIVIYALLPNHYHFILKQKRAGGISKFMQKLSMGYTNYFNFKHKRRGYLFQSKFKSIQIKTDEYLIYLSAYINGNPEIHKLSLAHQWPWSSYQDYLKIRNGTMCNKIIILNQFQNVAVYRKYVNIVINSSKQKKDDIKKHLLE